MAKLPTGIPQIVSEFGPTLNTIPPGGWIRNPLDRSLIRQRFRF